MSELSLIEEIDRALDHLSIRVQRAGDSASLLHAIQTERERLFNATRVAFARITAKPEDLIREFNAALGDEVLEVRERGGEFSVRVAGTRIAYRNPAFVEALRETVTQAIREDEAIRDFSSTQHPSNYGKGEG